MAIDWHYLYQGERRPLRPLASASLVTAAVREHLPTVAARLARSTRLSLDGTVPEGALLVRGDPAKLREVQDYADVRWARPLLADSQGRELGLTDEVVVGFLPTTSARRKRALCKELNCRWDVLRPHVWLLTLAERAIDAPLAAARHLAAQDQFVEYACPNMLQAARWEGAQVSLPSGLWHLENRGQLGGAPGADVGALQAWELTQGSPNLHAAVLDTGVAVDHPALAANLAPGYDFNGQDEDPRPDGGSDLAAHGTACAGLIAAVPGPAAWGVAPKCRVVPLRAQRWMTWASWGAAFRWTVGRAGVLCFAGSLSPNDETTAALADLEALGVLVVAASGNDGSLQVAYPASTHTVLAVGASTEFDELAVYSNGGPGLDLVAPGGGGGSRGLSTTDLPGDQGFNPAGEFCLADDASGFFGTSAACAVAAGAACLVRSYRPALSPAEVRQLLCQTAERIDPARATYDANQWSPRYGAGRINVGRALRELSP
jgi:hypothetical protein